MVIQGPLLHICIKWSTFTSNGVIDHNKTESKRSSIVLQPTGVREKSQYCFPHWPDEDRKRGSQNYRMAVVGRDLEDHLVSTPLP